MIEVYMFVESLTYILSPLSCLNGRVYPKVFGLSSVTKLLLKKCISFGTLNIKGEAPSSPILFKGR